MTMSPSTTTCFFFLEMFLLKSWRKSAKSLAVALWTVEVIATVLLFDFTCFGHYFRAWLIFGAIFLPNHFLYYKIRIFEAGSDFGRIGPAVSDWRSPDGFRLGGFGLGGLGLGGFNLGLLPPTLKRRLIVRRRLIVGLSSAQRLTLADANPRRLTGAVGNGSAGIGLSHLLSQDAAPFGWPFEWIADGWPLRRRWSLAAAMVAGVGWRVARGSRQVAVAGVVWVLIAWQVAVGSEWKVASGTCGHASVLILCSV
jgi:hypothetical protein